MLSKKINNRKIMIKIKIMIKKIRQNLISQNVSAA